MKTKPQICVLRVLLGLALAVSLQAQSKVIRLDLGPAESAAAEGFQRLSPDQRYDAKRGYGWQSSAQQAFDIERPPENPAWQGPSGQVIPEDYLIYKAHNPVTRDGVSSKEDLSLRLDVPDGRYRVRVTFGRLDRATCSMQLSLNGQVVAKDIDGKHFVQRGAPDHLYGFPRVVRSTVNAAGGSILIQVQGDDSGFRERFLKEFEREPPVSYLAGIPTRVRKPSQPDLSEWGKLDPGRGLPGGKIWVYADIGCPFTENAIAAVEIYPYQAPPLRWENNRLAADSGDQTLKQGAEHFNAGRFAEAEKSFRAVKDEYARALGLLWLAGAPEFEQERRLLPDAEKLLSSLANQPGADPLISEYLEQARALSEAVYRFDHAGERQRTYNELLLISGEVDSLQPGDPVYAKGKVYAGRGFHMIDPHRWAFASHAGKQILTDLERQGVKSRYIDWYLHGKWSDAYDDWKFPDYSAKQTGAPKWAAEVFEAYNRELDLTEWWIRNRQREDGALGGGWGDDVEILRGFGAFVGASPDASPLAVEGVRKVANGAWFSGSVDADAGYFAEVGDTEHTGEWTADTLMAMIQNDYGNPVYVERGLKTAKLMRDLWMDRNAKGQFLMRANFLGATDVGRPATQSDSRINYRPAAPALAVLRYNSLPSIEKLYVDWADTWHALSLSTGRGKPRGIIPQEIAFDDGLIGGVDSPTWYEAAHPPGTVNYDWEGLGSYHDAIVDLFLTAFRATGDRKYLEPMELEAEFVRKHLPEEVKQSPHYRSGGRQHPDLWKGLAEGGNEWVAAHLATWPQTWDRMKLVLFPSGSSSDGDLRSLAEATKMARQENQSARERWPHVTTEMIATDRVYYPGLGNGVRVVSGRDLFSFDPVASYRGLGRDFAAAVIGADAENLRVALYNFAPEAKDAELVPWMLTIGPNYKIEAGLDADSDGRFEKATLQQTETLRHRGQGFALKLPSRQAWVVKISKQSGEPKDSLSADLALSPQDIEFVPEYRRIDVTVHNIGGAPARGADVALYLNDKEIGRKRIPNIEAPISLQPQSVRIGFPHLPEAPSGQFTAVIDPENSIDEITEFNNRVTVELPTPLAPKKQHAHP